MITKIRIVLLFLLILFLPSQLGFHFWPFWSYVHGIPVDFLSPTIYFTDLILLGYFLSCLPLIHKTKFTSKLYVSLAIFVIFVVLNIIVSQSPILTLYKWLNLSKYLLLSALLYFQGYTVFPTIKKALLIATLWSSVLGWYQFVLQSSIGGLVWWLGERPLSSVLPGIAIVPSLTLNILNNTFYTQQLLRTYSTFPHPNSFAGFLLLSIILIYLLDLFSKKHRSLHINAILLFVATTIFITFSRTAIILLLSVSTIATYSRSKYLSILILILLIFSLPYFLQTGSPNALPDRLLLTQSAVTVSIHHPIFGTGLGTNPLTLSLPQPVHNIPLLLFSELGYPLSLILLFLLVKLVYIIYKRAALFSLPLILGYLVVLVTSLLDHYWLTLNQNMLLLSVFVSVSAIIAQTSLSQDTSHD